MAREPKQTHIKHYRKEENVDFVTLEQYFPVVEVESLTMGDRFLREHVPRSRNEERIWRSCECAVRYRTRNFRRNAVSPSINKEGKIVFKKGEKPAGGVEYKKKPIWLLFIFGVPSMGNNLRVKVPYRA